MSANLSDKPSVEKRPLCLFRPISLEGASFVSTADGDCTKQSSQKLLRPVPYTPKAGEKLIHLDILRPTSFVTENTRPETPRGYELGAGARDLHAASSDARNVASALVSSEASVCTPMASFSRVHSLRQEDVSLDPYSCLNVGSKGIRYEEVHSQPLAPNANASAPLFHRDINQEFVDGVLSEQLPTSAEQGTGCESPSANVFGRVSSRLTITSIQTSNSVGSAQGSDTFHPSPRKSGRTTVSGDEEESPSPETGVDDGMSPPDRLERWNTSRFLSSRRLSDPSYKSSFKEMKEEISRHAQNRLRGFVASSRGKASFEARAKERMGADTVLASSSGKDTGRFDMLPGKASMRRHTKAVPVVHLRTRLNLPKESQEDENNPWFQERNVEFDDEGGSSIDKRSYASSQSESVNSDQGSKFDKSKKIRFKKLGRMFRKDDDSRNSFDETETASSSSTGSPCITPSTTDEALPSQKDESHKESVSLDLLQENIKRAILKRQTLVDVLNLLAYLPDRPNEELLEMLFKYLGTSNALENGIKLLVDDSDPRILSGTSQRDYKLYREMLAYCYVSGPSRLRKAIFQHHKARGGLFTFLGSMHRDSPSSEKFAFKIHTLVSILNGMLHEFPTDFTDYLSGKKGFLHSLARNYIHIPEVVEFICQLCAADALADNDGDEFRYGAANAAGIVLLVKEGIPSVLVSIFGEASYPDGDVTDEKLRWQLQVMSLKCLLELSKRAVVVLKFSKTNCSYSTKFIKTVNTSLGELSPYENVERVSLVVDTGLSAVRQLNDESRFDDVIQCNNAAACAISFATELLDMVRSAQDCKSVVTRRTVGSIDTKCLEEMLVRKVKELRDLLNFERAANVRGRVRATIVAAFRSMFGSSNEETRRKLVECEVPRCLLDVVRMNPLCSILHGCVVECIAISLIRESSVILFEAWMKDLQRSRMLEEMAEAVERKGSDEMDGEQERSTYDSTLIDIGFVICMFSQKLTRGEFRQMFESEERYEMFTIKIEKGLGKVEERRRGSCGGPKPEGVLVSVLANADALAARLNDFEAF